MNKTQNIFLPANGHFGIITQRNTEKAQRNTEVKLNKGRIRYRVLLTLLVGVAEDFSGFAALGFCSSTSFYLFHQIVIKPLQQAQVFGDDFCIAL